MSKLNFSLLLNDNNFSNDIYISYEKCSQTLQSISKLERERKSSAQSKVEGLKNILRTSLMSLYTWTRNVKKSVKQLDEKINDLTQKVRKKKEIFFGFKP